MKPELKIVTSLVLFGVIGCGPADTGDEVESGGSTIRLDASEIDTLIAEQTTAYLRTQPTYASYLDMPVELAGGHFANRMPNYSEAGMQAVREVVSASADALAAIERDGLDERSRLNLAVVGHVNRYLAGVPGLNYGYIDYYFGHLPYVVNQISGPVIDIPKIMQTQQRVASLQDAADYIGRLRAFQPLLLGIQAKLEADAEAGVVPPEAIIDGSLRYLDGFTAYAITDHPLVVSLADKLEAIDAISVEERGRLIEDAHTALENYVYPGYRGLAAAVRTLKPRANEHDGIWAQPRGAEFYATAVRFQGDTDLTPDEIHELGLQEVARISAEMDTILREQGYAEGTVGERMIELGEEQRFLYPDTDEGRARLLSDLNDQITEINEVMPQYFATTPPQQIEVRRIPIFSQDGEAGGFYTDPSLDGTRPGIYWINLRDMNAWPSFALKTLTYHEAVPGHHFETSIGLTHEDLPFLRRSAPLNAFGEGWGLYSERLAWEMGMYDDDPFGNLGRLQDELWRAVRLVVDTGLHHKRWTREEAIEYMYATTGGHMSEVVPEIERYMAWPGQALGYKLGMLKILELRQQAQAALGDRFDLRAFHDVVLGSGRLPMTALQRNIEAWIHGMDDEG